MEMTETGARRLNDARLCVLRATTFDMTKYHTCGTPGCILGHYGAWHGQSAVQLVGLSEIETEGYTVKCLYDDSDSLERHFSISGRETIELFHGLTGCGRAQTPQQAADYIAAFLVRKGFAHCVTDRLSTEPEELVASAPASERCRGLRMAWEREVTV